MKNDFLDLLASDVVEAAQRLVGAHLVMGELRAAIVETEAYGGADDPASHAYRGKTKRNAVMFGEPGFAYVYFNYGVHWMLNLTAHSPGIAAAILIRSAMPLQGLAHMRKMRSSNHGREIADQELLSGPGKLTQALGIDHTQNGVFMFDRAHELQIEMMGTARPLICTPRIGIATGKGHEFPWRFVDEEHRQWASRNPRQKTPSFEPDRSFQVPQKPAPG